MNEIDFAKKELHRVIQMIHNGINKNTEVYALFHDGNRSPYRWIHEYQEDNHNSIKMSLVQYVFRMLQIIHKDQEPISLMITAHRQAERKTQQQVAELIGVPLISYRQWEKGRNFPPLDKAFKIAGALNFDIRDLG